MKKRIAVFGSTGTIGKNTLRVASHFSDSIEVVALATHSNIELLAQQIQIHRPHRVAVYDVEKGKELRRQFPALPVSVGAEGINELATYPEIDQIMMAIVGIAALAPTICAIQSKKTIALANKEAIVSAGEYITSLAKRYQIDLIPVDSEHSALFQCLDQKNREEIRKVIITASGGPFRLLSMQELDQVSVEDALSHPTWRMGPKITIDSSTLMNKGLEVIEAHWLFQLPSEKIEVMIHPQSIVHGLVEFQDGSLISQMSEPNMIYPIQYALTYPKREKGFLPAFDFLKNQHLEFFAPDEVKFPALQLAREALRCKSSFSCYLNAANEVFVRSFLNREISWKQIIMKLERLLARHTPFSLDSLETILAVDRQAREEAVS